MGLYEEYVDPGKPDFQENDFVEKFYSYLRHWKWILFSVIICLGLSYLYLKLVTPKYRIETDLLIKPDKSSPGSSNDLLQQLDMFSSDKIIDNEVQILKTKDIIEKVIRELNLQTSYYTVKGVRKREQYGYVPFEVKLVRPDSIYDYSQKFSIRILDSTQAEVNGKKVRLNYPVHISAGDIVITKRSKWKGGLTDLYDVKFNDLDDLIEFYNGQLRVEPISKEATVIKITIEDAIPERGKEILANLIKQYNWAATEDKNLMNESTLRFIQDRLKTIEGTLGGYEKKVEDYKSQNKITNIGSQAQILLQSVGENDAELNKVQIQINVLNSLDSYLKGSDNAPSNLPSMLGVDDPTLLKLVADLGEVQQRRLGLLQTVTETNPLVTSLDDQIFALKKQMYASITNLRRGLEITKNELNSRNKKFEGTISKVPGQERGLLDVMREQRLQDTLYTYLLQKKEEVQMKSASTASDSRTIDQVRSSKLPVKPVAAIVYLLFFLAGIGIPMVLIYLKDALNFRISKKQDIEKITNTPIIGEISQSNDPGSLLVSNKPRSMVAEQIRALRTNLQFVMPKEDQKVILFTSSISGEGKSFISLNLGASIAMSGKKVVILELDLRKPKLHSGLEMENTNGLSNYLINKTSLDKILKQVEQQENYYIITSGPIPPNPAELLVNGQIGLLIEKLKEQFDYIVLDAPPVGLVTDAQILAQYADATFFIVRHNYTAKNQIYAIDHLYQAKKFNNLNIIINSIEISRTYGYGYGYGYGGYYSDENDEKKSKSLKKLLRKE